MLRETSRIRSKGSETEFPVAQDESKTPISPFQESWQVLVSSRWYRSQKGRTPPPQIAIVPYYSLLHHEAIRYIYSKAFVEDPWPADWDAFDEFDPKGVFVASHTQTGRPVGYVISFGRRNFGYISVVAVIPGFRRQGIASALVAVIEY